MTRIIIDYETDPDFSFDDEEEWDCPECGHHNDDGASCERHDCNHNHLISLCTVLYDNNDKIVGSLSNSVFLNAADDWTTGSFDNVDDIPARCPHLRAVAANLIREHKSTMKTYTVTIAANVRAYATIEIEAADEHAAWQRATDIAAALENGAQGEPAEMDGVVFEAAYDTISDFEALEDLIEDGVTQ
jgi:hypothetical protein